MNNSLSRVGVALDREKIAYDANLDFDAFVEEAGIPAKQQYKNAIAFNIGDIETFSDFKILHDAVRLPYSVMYIDCFGYSHDGRKVDTSILVWEEKNVKLKGENQFRFVRFFYWR